MSQSYQQLLITFVTCAVIALIVPSEASAYSTATCDGKTYKCLYCPGYFDSSISPQECETASNEATCHVSAWNQWVSPTDYPKVSTDKKYAGCKPATPSPSNDCTNHSQVWGTYYNIVPCNATPQYN